MKINMFSIIAYLRWNTFAAQNIDPLKGNDIPIWTNWTNEDIKRRKYLINSNLGIDNNKNMIHFDIMITKNKLTLELYEMEKITTMTAII